MYSDTAIKIKIEIPKPRVTAIKIKLKILKPGVTLLSVDSWKFPRLNS